MGFTGGVGSSSLKGIGMVQLLLQACELIQAAGLAGLQLHDLAVELVAVSLQRLHLLLQDCCSSHGLVHLHRAFICEHLDQSSQRSHSEMR